MTDIRKAAEERYPHWLPPEPGTPDPDYSELDASWQNEMADDQRNAFIAGAEWMREQAAQVFESDGHHWSGVPATSVFEFATDAIRKIGENDD